MKKRIRLYMMAVTVLALAVYMAAGTLWIRDRFQRTVRQSLGNDLAAVLYLQPGPPEDIQRWVGELAASYSGEVRVTVTDRAGNVLGDSAADPVSMGNHLDREEFAGALSAGTGEAVRPSETTGVDTVYMARAWGEDHLLRLAMPVAAAGAFVRSLAPGMVLLLIAVFVLTRLFAGRLSDRIIAPYDKMFAAIEKALQNRDGEILLEAEYEEMEPVLSYFRTVLRQISDYVAQIKAKTEDIQNITGAMEEGLVLLDGAWNIVLINFQAAGMLGIPQDTWQKNITFLYRNASFVEMVERARETGKRQEEDIASGDRVLRFYINPAPGDGYVLLISDVTELNRLERIRSDFAANVSHELKTPLTSISGFAELIHAGMVADPEAVRDYAGKIHSESGRLIALIDDILRLSAIESGPEGGREPVPLREVFGYALEVLDGQIKERGLAVSLEGNLTLSCARERMYELAFNLLDNAVKYNRDGGTVSIRLGGEGFAVENTGEAIPAEHLPRIFERFYRVDKGRSRRTGGTGLGLSIARHIAALYGGSIRAESGEDRTVFTVAFPLEVLL